MNYTGLIPRTILVIVIMFLESWKPAKIDSDNDPCLFLFHYLPPSYTSSGASRCCSAKESRSRPPRLFWNGKIGRKYFEYLLSNIMVNRRWIAFKFLFELISFGATLTQGDRIGMVGWNCNRFGPYKTQVKFVNKLWGMSKKNSFSVTQDWV